MNILLVDDQATVLNGLRHGIDFEKLGYTNVFTATDAEAALKICRENPISVIVSDVEMPGKNGLELLSEVHEKYPDILRIVLTSHPVFSYAQEGLKQGIFDYIVQPAPFSEIEASFRKAANAVKQNSSDRRMYEYGNLFKLHESEFLTGIISQLYLNNPQDVDESISLLNQSGYAFTKSSLIQILWIDVFSHTHRDPNAPSKHDILTALNEIIKELPELSSYASFITPNSLHVFSVFIISPISAMSELSRQTLMALEEMLKERLHSRCAIYSSGLFRYQEIGTIMDRARFVISNNITYEPGIHYISEASPNTNIESTLSDYLRHWDNLLRSGQMTMLRKDILFCLARASKLSQNKYQALCKIHQQLLQLFLRYFYDNNIDTAAFLTGEHSYRRLMDYCSSVEDVIKMLDFLIDATESSVSAGEKEDDYVANAKDYITKHYNEDISVKAVSDHVHLNPEYFTRLFKKETGMNIKDFITDCRISMAKDLLQNTNLTISMIASEVGYSSFPHFTSMFKRVTGMTPSFYRTAHETPGENA